MALLQGLVWTAMLAAVSVAQGATLTVQPQAGEPATKVDLRGSGMGAFETVELRYDDTALGVARANAEGAFRADDVEIPAAALPGRRPIAVVGRSSGTRATVSFLVRSNWPQFHRGPFRHGEVPHENVPGPDNVARLRLLWNAPSGLAVGSSMQGSPVVADGMVYILTSDLAQRGLLLALDAATGARRWTQPLRSATVCETTPAVAQGRVYAPSLGRMTAFDARTGAVRWRAGSSMCASGMTPTLVDGKLFTLTSKEHNLEARHPAVPAAGFTPHSPPGTASSTWPTPTAACRPTTQTAAASSGRAWSTRTTSSVGLRSWKARWSTSASLALAADCMRSTGARAPGCGRRRRATSTVRCRPWPTAWLYVGSSDGSGLWAIDARTGALRWRQAAVRSVRASPAVANGVVYLAAEDGCLYALEARTGAVLHSIQVAPAERRMSPSPAVADGVVYVGIGDRMMAFGLKPDAADTGR